MNTRKINQATRLPLTTFSAMGALALCSAVLVACGGGGGGVGGAGTGATATGFSAGAVTGKGSTIVNGVEYIDDSAEVRGEDDSLTDDKGGKLDGNSVKLGMEVEIEHGVVTCPTAGLSVASCDVTPTATATKVSFGNNSLVAPITNFVSATAPGVTPATFGSFTLLGQLVVMTASTELNLDTSVTGVGALGDGVVVEVHGSFNQVTSTTTATRVEVKAATRNAFAGAFRLRGVLDLKTTPPTIGGTAVTMSADQIASLTDGQVVRAKLTVAAAAPYVVQSVKSAQRKLDDHKGAEAEVEGVIDTVGAVTAGVLHFTINGAAVSVDTATLSATGLTLGARVEVEGKVDAAGTLVASKVTLHNEANDVLIEKEFLGYTLKPRDANGSAFDNTYDPAAHTFEVWTTTKPYVLRETVVIIQAGDNSGQPATVFRGKQGAPASEADIARQTGTNFDLFDILGHRRADGKLVASHIQIQPKKGV